MCGACREADCECCDLLVWGGPCECGCYTADPALRAPFTSTPIVVYMRYVPGPPQRRQRRHCNRGHELSGSNVYIEDGSSTRRCWTCRRASWRRYQYRAYQKKQRQQGEAVA
jgi:hypothetical protein